MGSKVIVLLGLFSATVLIISSEVAARELAEISNDVDTSKKTNGTVDGGVYPHYTGGYGGEGGERRGSGRDCGERRDYGGRRGGEGGVRDGERRDYGGRRGGEGGERRRYGGRRGGEGGERRGYGGRRGGYGSRRGGYCHHGCCGKGYNGGCRCCTFAGEKADDLL